ncbi:MAG: dihydropteroate synthase [Armatimonadetes bacterium]|nr:dihydropteroate synthase [Armatimonadota bacterium]
MFHLPDGRVCVMGVLNVTPDSFSDGGLHLSADEAVSRGQRLHDEGADIVDVGGESTRPGADPVAEEEEAGRVLPVIERLAALGVPVSVDTMKPEVARRAMAAGARMINDVSGFGDEKMRRVAAQSGATVCIMHMQGEPRSMQASPMYGDVVEEVRAFLTERAALCLHDGIQKERIWVDPGIGFGKTVEHNLSLLANLDRLAGMGYPVLAGVSRKSFIGRIAGPEDTGDRLPGSLAAGLAAVANGASVLRVHDIKETAQALKVWGAVTRAR